jgi:hypothetical protein
MDMLAPQNPLDVRMLGTARQFPGVPPMVTSMPQPCVEANGKQWSKYLAKANAARRLYRDALCTETSEIRMFDLIESPSERPGSYQGTWVHPQVAVDLGPLDQRTVCGVDGRLVPR